MPVLNFAGLPLITILRDHALPFEEDKPMNWFRPMGFVFRPASIAGWLISLAALAFCAEVFIAVDARSHSASDTFYGIFPFWASTWLGLAWIADRTGGRD